MTEFKAATRTDDSLPPGKTCADCHWAKRCDWLIGSRFSSDSVRCDWAPSRFRAAEKKAESTAK